MTSKRKNLIKISAFIFAVIAVLTASIATSSARFGKIASLNSTARTKGFFVTFNIDEDVNVSSFEFSLADTDQSQGISASDVVAPGSFGSFTITIDATMCETDITWSINFAKRDPTMEVDNETVERPYPPIDFTTNYSGSKKYIRMGETIFNGSWTWSSATQSQQYVTIFIGWTWPINTRTDDVPYAGDDYVYKATVTVEQTL